MVRRRNNTEVIEEFVPEVTPVLQHALHPRRYLPAPYCLRRSRSQFLVCAGHSGGSTSEPVSRRFDTIFTRHFQPVGQVSQWAFPTPEGRIIAQ